MKRSLINKLGTALNTIGSLGVGYYVAKFHLLQDLRAFEILEGKQWLMIGGSLLVLTIGLILRIRDLINRKHEEEDLRKEVGWAEEVADQNAEHANELQDRLEDAEGLLDTVVRRVVMAELPNLVEDYLENKAEKATLKLETDPDWERE